jgi:Bacterial regulatory proteins, lacI family.
MNIKDIAELPGVSRSTISMMVNNHPTYQLKKEKSNLNHYIVW